MNTSLRSCEWGNGVKIVYLYINISPSYFRYPPHFVHLFICSFVYLFISNYFVDYLQGAQKGQAPLRPP